MMRRSKSADLAQTASPYPSAPDYLASKIYWTIRVASEGFQVRWALDLITAFVNKRINGQFQCETSG